MFNTKQILTTEQQMIDFGTELAKSAFLGRRTKNPIRVIELIGDVGTGKTTITKGVAKHLKIADEITSPSFTISKHYEIPDGKELVHYDFYRLGDPGLMSEDLYENLSDPSKIVILEWADSVASVLPPNHVTIYINMNDDGSRTVMATIEKGKRWNYI
ncbi:MAG: tRNA (adenosine(37)-N6)-threonylcarbamoyltransferase complex ATPase subunit type 1 TsaE [Candidatus Saccharibacteria bacterium]|nr:tRNA (adenosine(37)-N6)-threonylcarbamoyltransferase complex ATPase subunit type 1 TsaE [Candidatus Saccharibacteria bacterium]